MATEALRAVTLVAGAVVAQRRFVTINSSGLAIQATANDDAVGVSLSAAAVSGDSIPVALMEGIAEVESGAAVTIGDAIKNDATGRAISMTATVTDVQIGYALEAAGAAGEFITVLLSKKAANIAIT